jgi:hypothetical protein
VIPGVFVGHEVPFEARDRDGRCILAPGTCVDTMDLAMEYLGVVDLSDLFSPLPSELATGYRFVQDPHNACCFPLSDPATFDQLTSEQRSRYIAYAYQGLLVLFFGPAPTLVAALQSLAMLTLTFVRVVIYVVVPIILPLSIFRGAEALFTAYVQRYIQVWVASIVVSLFSALGVALLRAAAAAGTMAFLSMLIIVGLLSLYFVWTSIKLLYVVAASTATMPAALGSGATGGWTGSSPLANYLHFRLLAGAWRQAGSVASGATAATAGITRKAVSATAALATGGASSVAGAASRAVQWTTGSGRQRGAPAVNGAPGTLRFAAPGAPDNFEDWQPRSNWRVPISPIGAGGLNGQEKTQIWNDLQEYDKEKNWQTEIARLALPPGATTADDRIRHLWSRIMQAQGHQAPFEMGGRSQNPVNVYDASRWVQEYVRTVNNPLAGDGERDRLVATAAGHIGPAARTVAAVARQHGTRATEGAVGATARALRHYQERGFAAGDIMGRLRQGGAIAEIEQALPEDSPLRGQPHHLRALADALVAPQRQVSFGEIVAGLNRAAATRTGLPVEQAVALHAGMPTTFGEHDALLRSIHDIRAEHRLQDAAITQAAAQIGQGNYSAAQESLRQTGLPPAAAQEMVTRLDLLREGLDGKTQAQTSFYAPGDLAEAASRYQDYQRLAGPMPATAGGATAAGAARVGPDGRVHIHEYIP